MNHQPSFEVLSDGSLVLILREVCIQTTARQAHREITERLLVESSPDAALEISVELLKRFLVSTDFARLRTEHPELAGGTHCRVRLMYGEGGLVRWEIIQMSSSCVE
jgi:hypothetical protein